MSDAPGVHLDRPYGGQEAQAAAVKVMTRLGHADLLPMLGLAEDTEPRPQLAGKPPAETQGRPSTRRMPAELEQQIAQAYADGGPVREIAPRFGVSTESVRQAVLRTGGTMRKRGATVGEKGNRKLTDAQEAEMVRQYLNGTSSQFSVAADFGVSRKVLQNALDRARNAGAE